MNQAVYTRKAAVVNFNGDDDSDKADILLCTIATMFGDCCCGLLAMFAISTAKKSLNIGRDASMWDRVRERVVNGTSHSGGGSSGASSLVENNARAVILVANGDTGGESRNDDITLSSE